MEKGINNSEGGGPEETKGVTRREFLKRMGIVLAAASAAGAGIEMASRSGQDATRADSKTPVEPTIERPIEEIVFKQNGVMVWAEDGIPTRWKDGAREGVFDREKIISIKEESDRTLERQLVEVIRVRSLAVSDKSEGNSFTPENVISELPNDSLSIEELRQRGIQIIGSDFINIHLRRSAFAEGGLLEGYVEGGDKKLYILVTSKSSITQEAFSDPKYSVAQSAISRLASVAERNISEISVHASDNTEHELRTRILNEVSIIEMVDWGLIGPRASAWDSTMVPNSNNSSYVFFSVPDEDYLDPVLNCLQVIYSASQGFVCSIESVRVDTAYNVRTPLSLSADSNYDNPERYQGIENPGEGTFQWKILSGVDPACKDPYFVFMHELEHIRRFGELNSLPSRPEGLELMRYFSEWEIDRATLGILESAYQSWVTIGDNSKYPFVIEDIKSGTFNIG